MTLTPAQTHLLNGCARFSAVLGDILSAKAFDCVCAVKHASEYQGRVKQLTNRLETARRKYESDAARNITDMDAFADVCQDVDDYCTKHFLNLRSAVMLALGARKGRKGDASVLALLLTAVFYAETVREVRNAMLRALKQKGVPATGFRCEPHTLEAPLRALALEYAGTDAREEIKRTATTPQVQLGGEILMKRLVNDVLTQIIKDN